MTKGNRITEDKVEAIKAFDAKYPMLSCVEVGKIFDVSRATVSLVRSGYYDNMGDEKPVKAAKNDKVVDMLESIYLALLDIASALERRGGATDCVGSEQAS